MSYGFYKLPPRSSHEDYIVKVAGKTMIAIAVSDHTVEMVPMKVDTITLSYSVDTTEQHKQDFRANGYSGDVCTQCSGVRLRWAGHCQVCDDCGTTTGCS